MTSQDTLLLDCIGLSCPEPVIRCHNAIKNLRPAHITVLIDNMAAYENVARALAKHGYISTSTEEMHNGATVWRLAAVDQGATSASAESPASAAFSGFLPRPQQNVCAKVLVLLTSEFLGKGSDELGAKLMENFLSTLPEMGESLWKVVLLNSGVKLSAKPGKSLDSLKSLAADGVQVLVCGACLTFYELLESKAVGETTNMLDVVSSLSLADKVICP